MQRFIAIAVQAVIHLSLLKAPKLVNGAVVFFQWLGRRLEVTSSLRRSATHLRWAVHQSRV